MKTKCPTCSLRYDYELDEAGQTVDCQCGAKVLLPGPEVRAAQKAQKCVDCGAALTGTSLICDRCSELKTERRRAEAAAAQAREIARRQAIQKEMREVPELKFVLFLAMAFRAVGVVEIAVGAAWFLLGATKLTSMTDESGWVALVMAIGTTIGGLVWIAIGQVVECIRRVTINSCLMRNYLADMKP